MEPYTRSRGNTPCCRDTRGCGPVRHRPTAPVCVVGFPCRDRDPRRCAAGGGLVVRRGGHASCGPDASGAPKGGHGVVGLEPSLVGQRSLVVTAAGRPLSMMLTIRLGWRNRTAVVEEGSFVVKEGMEGSRPRRRRAVAPLPTPAPWPSLRPGPPVPRLAPVAPYALATFGRIDLPARRLRSSPGDRDRLVTRARRS